ncbi:MAG: archaeosortase/exosortase family protein [Gemmatimonadota bacterium]
MTAIARRFSDPRIGLGLVAFALVPTWIRFPAFWNQFNEHGYLAAATVLWLVARTGRAAASVEDEAFAEGIGLLLLLSVVWASAVAIDIGVVHMALALAIPALWMVTLYGVAVLPPLVPIGLTALLALPLWDALNPTLQRLTALVSGAVTLLAGIEAEIGELTIELDVGTVIVAAGCSGLGYFLSSVTLAAAYAHLFVRQGRTKLHIVAVAGLFGLAANWVRVAILVYLADATAMESELLHDHVTFGWIVWMVSLVPTYWVTRRIESRAAGRGERHGEAPDVATPGPVRVPARRERLALAATAAAIVGPMLYGVLSVLPRPAPALNDSAVFPVVPRVTVERRGPEWIPAYQGIDAQAGWVSRVDGVDVQLGRFAFVDQRPGEELVQGANQLTAVEDGLLLRRVLPIGSGESRLVEESVIRTEEGVRLVWSWFRVAGWDTPFPLRAKLFELVAWVRRTPPSELVTISARCGPSDCEAAGRALRVLVGDATEGGPSTP